MNAQRLASVCRERFPRHAQTLVALFGPLFDWDVALQPRLPDLENVAKRAVFWAPIQTVAALEPSEVAVIDFGQEAIASAFAQGFKDVVHNLFRDGRVVLRASDAELDEIGNILDPMFSRMEDQLRIVIGMTLPENNDAIVHQISSSILVTLKVASVSAFGTILADHPEKANDLRPFFQIFLDGNPPFGYDFATQTLAVLVSGDRPTLLEKR